MTTEAHVITDNLDELLAVLPDYLRARIGPDERIGLIEVVLDLGRRPEARFVGHYAYLSEAVVTRQDLDDIESRLGAFGDDNRAGIPATLHRISAMRNRRGAIVGLTLRVGRAVTGIVDILRDIIESGQSLLLMGRPGLGKTTLLREMARVMADELGKRVVIVDTSNEIAGDGDVPHPAIGRARRMQVARVAQQHDVMIEAVENHMPEVVVIDEIGRAEETLAARTIAERGVQLIATVHGNTLDNLLANPTLSDLIGGVGAVTLSDEEARRRGTQKTVLERKAPPTFNAVVEMIERDRVAVRAPVGEIVDTLLRGGEAPPELRWRDENGQVQRAQMAPTEPPPKRPPSREESREPRGRNGRFERRDGRESREERGRPERRDGGSRDFNGIRDANNTRDYGARSAPTRESRAMRRWGLEPESRTADDEPMLSVQTLSVQSFGAPVREIPSPASDVEEEEEEEEADDDYEEPELEGGTGEEDLSEGTGFINGPLDAARVRRVYPFGVSRSRLTRAVKHLGLPLTVARTWKEADAVLMLSGSSGLTAGSSLLKEARDMGLPIAGVKGNTYAQILARLNDLFGAQMNNGPGSTMSPREVAVKEARDAAQRVLSEAEPVELRPQGRTLRRVQHQLAERYHLRSYSVGREPLRRVRFLPSTGR